MKDVPKNMRRTGMLLFRDAFMEAVSSSNSMCVVHTAHAAEILLKARIAQEHLLLIFSKLPNADFKQDALTLSNLLENGQTFSYAELPNRLRATTGIKIEQLDKYLEFGQLRNQIIHFSMANADNLDVLTLRYSLEVLDPLVECFWGKSVIDFITNAPPNYYPGFVDCGFFEDSLREKLEIDQRLKRLLGEKSRKAWEELNAHRDEMKRLNSFETDKDWEVEYAQYEDWEELNPAYQEMED